MPKLTGASLLYPHVSLPWGEKQEAGDNEQVIKLFKTFPPSVTQGVERAKSAIYKAFVGLGRKFNPVRGCWATPTHLVPRAEYRFEEAKDRFWNEVDMMGGVYEMLRATAQANLGERFEPRDYPEWEVLRSQVKCQLVAFTVDEADSAPDSALPFSSLLEGFRLDAYKTLCTEFSTLLRGMVYRLTEGKRFHSEKVVEFGQFLDDFGALASLVNGSAAEADLLPLQTLVAQAKEALDGVVDPEALKGNKDLRGSIGATLNAVGATLDTFMSLPVGARRLQFTPDPE